MYIEYMCVDICTYLYIQIFTYAYTYLIIDTYGSVVPMGDGIFRIDSNRTISFKTLYFMGKNRKEGCRWFWKLYTQVYIYAYIYVYIGISMYRHIYICIYIYMYIYI
jgi:hypothetical protein